MTQDEKMLEAAGRAMRDSIPLLEFMDVEVVHLEPGTASIEAPPEPNVNHVGMMYAGSLFTLGEILGGIIPPATWTMPRHVPVVGGVEIKFRRPAFGRIRATASVSDADLQRVQEELDAGVPKVRFTMEAILTDPSGQLVATTVGHYVLLEMPA